MKPFQAYTYGRNKNQPLPTYSKSNDEINEVKQTRYFKPSWMIDKLLSVEKYLHQLMVAILRSF